MPNYNEEHQILQRKMVLSGKGEVSVNPDIASISIGVQTNGDSVTIAQSENARISQNVINTLKQIGISDIKTIQYQIDKLYDYENGKQIDRGYQVRNILEVKVNNLSLIGNAIDSAVQSGANVVQDIRFDVSNSELYYQQALNMAVQNAIQKAKSIASSLKAMLDPLPILITENSNFPTPFTRNFAAGEIAYTTPIEPGTNQIKASVTVEFLY